MEIQPLSIIPLVLELTAAILATIYFGKYKESTEKFFLYFLWYTFVVELLGAYLGYVVDVKNFWLYNAFTITSFLFYFYWYHSILESQLFKKLVFVFSAIFLIVAAWSLVYHNWVEYHKYTFITGALSVLVLTLFHFYQLLYSDEVLIVKYKLSFWISTALLLFYMGMIPLFSLSGYIEFRGLSYLVILLILNSILYGCYSIGFIWTKKKYNRF